MLFGTTDCCKIAGWGAALGSVDDPKLVCSCIFCCHVSGSTAAADACKLEYTIDDSCWLPCTTSLRLGPLLHGEHVLSVRCTDAVSSSPPVSWSWTIQSQSNYQLQVGACLLLCLFIPRCCCSDDDLVGSGLLEREVAIKFGCAFVCRS